MIFYIFTNLIWPDVAFLNRTGAGKDSQLDKKMQ